MVIRTRDNTPTGWLHRFPVAGFGSEHTRTMHAGQTRRLRDDCHTTDHVNDITTGTRIRLTVITVIIQRIGVNSVTFQVPLWCYRGPYSITFVSAYAFPGHRAYAVACRAEKERPVPEHGLISFAGAVTGRERTRPYRPLIAGPTPYPQRAKVTDGTGQTEALIAQRHRAGKDRLRNLRRGSVLCAASYHGYAVR